jgi:hypothetical protein
MQQPQPFGVISYGADKRSVKTATTIKGMMLCKEHQPVVDLRHFWERSACTEKEHEIKAEKAL